MKNLNKLFAGLILAFVGVTFVSSKAHASIVARGPKEIYVSTFTSGNVSVTPAVSTPQANAAFQPGAVYQLIFSTGAAGEFFTMYDSTGAAGIGTCGAPPPSTANIRQLGPRFNYGSSTTTFTVTLDPPLVFTNGLIACDSASTGQVGVSYELGRGLSGQ